MADVGSTARRALSMGGPKTSAGKSLIASAPAWSKAKASVGLKNPGKANRPRLLRGTHNRRVRMWSDDQPATRRCHFPNLRWSGQSAGPNQHPAAEAARQDGDALQRAGRIERNLNDADARPFQCRADRFCLGRLNAAQDGNQRAAFEPCSYVQCSLLPMAASPSAAASSSCHLAPPPQASMACA